jgi:hypothetical protein
LGPMGRRVNHTDDCGYKEPKTQIIPSPPLPPPPPPFPPPPSRSHGMVSVPFPSGGHIPLFAFSPLAPLTSLHPHHPHPPTPRSPSHCPWPPQCVSFSLFPPMRQSLLSPSSHVSTSFSPSSPPGAGSSFPLGLLSIIGLPSVQKTASSDSSDCQLTYHKAQPMRLFPLPLPTHTTRPSSPSLFVSLPPPPPPPPSLLSIFNWHRQHHRHSNIQSVTQTASC